MSSPWRTVYKSAHKQVMVKPHSHPRGHRHVHIHPSAPVNIDLSWIWWFAQIFVVVFTLCFIVDLIITFWPFLLIGCILVFILIAARS